MRGAGTAYATWPLSRGLTPEALGAVRLHGCSRSHRPIHEARMEPKDSNRTPARPWHALALALPVALALSDKLLEHGISALSRRVVHDLLRLPCSPLLMILVWLGLIVLSEWSKRGSKYS